MPAFVIGQLNIHNRDWMEEYFSKVPDLVTKHRGHFKVRGGDPAWLEGDAPVPDAAVVIEFPDRADAEAFWASSEFQTLAKLRQSGSTLNAILVDTL